MHLFLNLIFFSSVTVFVYAYGCCGCGSYDDSHTFHKCRSALEQRQREQQLLVREQKLRNNMQKHINIKAGEATSEVLYLSRMSLKQCRSHQLLVQQVLELRPGDKLHWEFGTLESALLDFEVGLFVRLISFNFQRATLKAFLSFYLCTNIVREIPLTGTVLWRTPRCSSHW